MRRDGFEKQSGHCSKGFDREGIAKPARQPTRTTAEKGHLGVAAQPLIVSTLTCTGTNGRFMKLVERSTGGFRVSWADVKPNTNVKGGSVLEGKCAQTGALGVPDWGSRLFDRGMGVHMLRLGISGA